MRHLSLNGEKVRSTLTAQFLGAICNHYACGTVHPGYAISYEHIPGLWTCIEFFRRRMSGRMEACIKVPRRDRMTV